MPRNRLYYISFSTTVWPRNHKQH